MSYQLYRNTTLGHSLQEALEELIQTQQIDPDLGLNVLLQFDKTINAALANRLRTKMSFKGHLRTYRFCDSVWTLVVENGEFREVGNDSNTFKVDKLKVVACDGRASSTEKE